MADRDKIIEHLKTVFRANYDRRISQISSDYDYYCNRVKNGEITLASLQVQLRIYRDDLEELERTKVLIGKFGAAKEAIDEKISKRKAQIQEKLRQIESFTNSNNYYDNLSKEKYAQLKKLKDEGFYGDLDRIADEIEKITESKKVKNVELTDHHINVYTKELNIYEPVYGKTWYLGEMKIQIPYYNGDDIYMKNMTHKVNAYEEEMNHPHVWRNGTACWGTAQGFIVKLQNEQSYFVLFLMILSFLETCDVRDSAGKFVPSWGEVNPETGEHIVEENRVHYNNAGRIVNYYEEGEVMCHVCGEYYDASDVSRCEWCDEYTCSNCGGYEDTEDGEQWICEHCRDNANICDECGCYILDDDNVYEDDGLTLCPKCHEEREQRNERRESA